MKLLLTFVRDEVIERRAALVGMEPIWFFATIIGPFLVGVILWVWLTDTLSKRGTAPPAPKA